MAALELKFLGDLEVIRDGQCVLPPPSRKTRAPLAYLALNPRVFRREHLCELLREIPDDPRGSLRWSLSKLRHLVDDGAHHRIVADRITIGFDATDVAIDVSALKALTDRELEHCPLEQLENAATRFSGSPLEGLELPDFHDFDSWCSAERECAIRAQKRLLAELVRRLSVDPERALPHAPTLVRISPYDENARADLIRLLVALGRNDQAQQQYLVGTQLLKEAGATSTGELYCAWRRAPGVPSARHVQRPPEAVREEQPPPSPTAAPQAPAFGLIGRDAELARISAALAQALERRRGNFLLVTRSPMSRSRAQAGRRTTPQAMPGTPPPSLTSKATRSTGVAAFWPGTAAR